MEDETTYLQAFLDPGEKRPGERVLGAISYGPDATLVVTNQRIVGKTGPHTDPTLSAFHGEVAYADLVEVEYLPGAPLIGTPGLHFKARRPDGNLQETTLRFPGRINAFLLYRLAGFNPRRIYQLIVEQMQRKGGSHGPAEEVRRG